MFGILSKPKDVTGYTFSDGSRLVEVKGERRFYPVNTDPNTTKTYISDEYMIWTDTHPEAGMFSMTVPHSYRVNMGHLFPGAATFKMLFSIQQQEIVTEFLNQKEQKIIQEKAAVAAQKAVAALLESRRTVVDTNISVLVDGKQAPISIQDDGLGAVLCPVCEYVLRTPDGALDHIPKALNDLKHIKAYSAETLTHCKQCNELYKVVIDIKATG